MITEDYVSFETAKLLKEKGFDEPCIGYYNPIDGCFFEGSIRKSWDYNRHGSINAPTLQMAMKWLREEMGIYIEIRRNLNIFYFKWCIQEGATDKAFSEYKYKSYEEAVEAAIKCCLENLI